MKAERLTQKEVETLSFISKGYTNKRIAQETGISERTAETHASNVIGKLYVQDRVGAAIVGINSGLVDLLAISQDVSITGISRLTKKEHEVIRTIFENVSGSHSETAESLKVSSRTIDTHIAHIKVKLGVHNANEVILAYAKNAVALIAYASLLHRRISNKGNV